MGRIRTVKPEFWTNEKVCALPEPSRLLALALLNYADDHGYFNANPALVRAACCPLAEPSRPLTQCLADLVAIDYVRIRRAADGREYGWVVGFARHQRVNRPAPSKIAGLVTFTEDSLNDHGGLTEDSLNDHGGLTEDSLQEQGTGNREQGTGKGSAEGNGTAGATAPAPPSVKTKKPKAAPSPAALAVRDEIAKLAGVIYPPSSLRSLDNALRDRELTEAEALDLVRGLAKDTFWLTEVRLKPSALFRPSKWPELLAQVKATRKPMAANDTYQRVTLEDL